MSNIQERQYQEDAESGIREAIRQGFRRILLVVPTGGGKTTIMSKIILRATQREKKSLVVAHRKELIDQGWARLGKFGVSAGRIMGAKHRYGGAAVNVASIQTLTRRDSIGPQDLVFIDEAHRAASGGYVQLQEEQPDAIFIGLTATPRRLDGKPLGDHFDVLIEVISVRELVELGFLVLPRYYGAPIFETEGVSKSMGDFNTSQLFEQADKKALYVGTVRHWKRWAEGMKTAVFCVNVEHSMKTVAEFRSQGVVAEHLDAETPTEERERLLAAFASGYITVLSNVGILTEGFDLPDLECVIINRATDSESLYLQIGGRLMRPSPGKRGPILIDQGDNVKRHGFLDADREWSLQGRKKSAGLAPVKYCKNETGKDEFGPIVCDYLNHAGAKFCDDCGAEFLVEKAEEKEAEFVELIPTRLQKLTRDMTVPELAEFSRIKKYQPGWAVRELRDRANLQAQDEGRDELQVFEELLKIYGKEQGYKPAWAFREVSKAAQAFYE